MRRIFLLRHAKSSWQANEQEDFERPLNERGRRAVPVIGAFMLQNDIAPDLILCSTACRARETLALVLPFLRGEATIRLEDGLYLASGAALAARLKRLDDDARQAMIIAHNPGLQDLALALSVEDASKHRQAIASKLPTAALVQIEIAAGPWSALEPHRGALARFVTARSLTPGTNP